MNISNTRGTRAILQDPENVVKLTGVDPHNLGGCGGGGLERAGDINLKVIQVANIFSSK